MELMDPQKKKKLQKTIRDVNQVSKMRSNGP